MTKIKLRHSTIRTYSQSHARSSSSQITSIAFIRSEILKAYTDPLSWMRYHHIYNQFFVDESRIEIQSKSHATGMCCLGLHTKGCSFNALYLVLRDMVEKHGLLLDSTIVDLSDEFTFKLLLSDLE
jgi:hypothetical protein